MPRLLLCKYHHFGNGNSISNNSFAHILLVSSSTPNQIMKSAGGLSDNKTEKKCPNKVVHVLFSALSNPIA